jgi:hypothetical protein
VSVRLVRKRLEEYEPVKLDGPECVYDFMRDLNQSDREISLVVSRRIPTH